MTSADSKPAQADLKSVRNAFMVAIALALAGYAAAPMLPAPAQATPARQIGQPAGAYNLDTPIEDIAATPRGQAVLNRDIPGLLQNASYPMFKALSLHLIGRLSGGRLTGAMLAKTGTDLAMLPAPGSPLRQVSQTYADPDFN